MTKEINLIEGEHVNRIQGYGMGLQVVIYKGVEYSRSIYLEQGEIPESVFALWVESERAQCAFSHHFFLAFPVVRKK